VTITGKQRRQLRALGHHLHAVVQVGGDGVTEGVLAATSQALEDHELIKVRIADEREGRQAAIDALAQGTRAEIAQVLGRTVLLFKRRKKNPELRFDGEPPLAKDPAPGPKRPAPKKRGAPKKGPHAGPRAGGPKAGGQEPVRAGRRLRRDAE